MASHWTSPRPPTFVSKRSMTLLASLPPDGVHLMLRYLDSESLVRLFATFNRKLQKSMSSFKITHFSFGGTTSNFLKALPHEPLSPARSNQGPWNYFLRHCFRKLPHSALQHLRSPLTLAEIQSIRAQQPDCRIECLGDLDLSTPDSIRAIGLFLDCVGPVFDLPKLRLALIDSLGPLVSFHHPITNNFPDANRTPKPMPYPSKMVHIDQSSGLPYFVGFSHLQILFPYAKELTINFHEHLHGLPSTLTKLEILDLGVPEYLFNFLPNTLTHLSSSSTRIFKLEFRRPKHLKWKFKHLNVPNWCIPWFQVLHDSIQPETEILKIGKLVRVPDWLVPPLFARLSTETLRSAPIEALDYSPTGYWLEHSLERFKEYTVPLMMSRTHEILEAKIKHIFNKHGATILPLLARYSRLPTVLVMPTHREIESIICEHSTTWRPVNASSLDLVWNADEIIPWALQRQSVVAFTSNNNLRDLVLAGDHCILGDEFFIFPVSWPSSLTRLWLTSHAVTNFKFVDFPPALVTLGLHENRLIPLLFGMLEVPLPFPLARLPHTLKQLTIQSDCPWKIKPSPPTARDDSSIDRPSASPFNLTLARFAGVTLESLALVCEALSLETAQVEILWKRDLDSTFKTWIAERKNIKVVYKRSWTYLD